MAEEDDAFLGEHGVDEDDDGVRVGATGGEVWVQHKGLGGGGVGGGEGLDEFDKGEITDSFGGDAGGDLDGDRNAVVYNFRFELVSVPGDGISLSLAR